MKKNEYINNFAGTQKCWVQSTDLFFLGGPCYNVDLFSVCPAFIHPVTAGVRIQQTPVTQSAGDAGTRN